MSSKASRSSSPSTSLDQRVPGAFPESTGPTRFTSQQSLAQALWTRRPEYTRPRQIRIKIGTWNVAHLKGTEKDVAGWFVEGKGIAENLAGLAVSSPYESHEQGAPIPEQGGKLDNRESVEAQEARASNDRSTLPKRDEAELPAGEEVDIYALGLQEVVDVSSAAEALRPYTDPEASKMFKAEMEKALPPGYELVAEQQLIGLLLLIYASPSIAPEINSTSTTSVGTGLMGYMGNKGAVTARLVLGETTRLVFINSHLAAGADKTTLDRRNWDASQIVSRTRFDPVDDPTGLNPSAGETIGDEDFAFWFGDLNYRLQGMPGDDVRRLLMLHTRNEYDIAQKKASDMEKDISEPTTSSNAADGNERASQETANSDSARNDSNDDALPVDADPASLQTTLSSLLPHDELHQQMKARKSFHDGWKEGHIRFMPTYKYDVGSVGVFDSSEKKRCPSWCDRILYRTRADKLAYEDKVKDEADAKRRDEEMRKAGTDKAGEDEDILFDYDPETDGADDYNEEDDFGTFDEAETVPTKAGFEDEITLEHYTSHQRVLSSDHKPLNALFILKYDAVVPELKAKIHEEVVRDLDRAENEGRPTITLIVDRPHDRCSEDDKSFEGVDFGHVRFAQNKRRSITIANTGQVPATICFIDRPVPEGESAGPTPPWLSIRFDRAPDPKENTKSQPQESNSQSFYSLEPGDVCNIELILRIEMMELVRNLNAHAANLEDILVLRVQDGRDHFLPLRAHWLQSSLGRTIDKLIRIPEGGVRRLQHQRPDDSRSGTTDSPGPAQKRLSDDQGKN